jgi:hypothetical protein
MAAAQGLGGASAGHAQGREVGDGLARVDDDAIHVEQHGLEVLLHRVRPWCEAQGKRHGLLARRVRLFDRAQTAA